MGDLDIYREQNFGNRISCTGAQAFAGRYIVRKSQASAFFGTRLRARIAQLSKLARAA
jgi:hypothetical protein